MKEVKVTINDTVISVPSDMTIMEAASLANIDISKALLFKGY